MKSFNVLTVLAAVALSVSFNAMATESNQQLIQNQQLSKRPYQAVPDQTSKEEGWEGASLVDKSNDAASNKSIQQIRLHMLGKRPYMDTQK